MIIDKGFWTGVLSGTIGSILAGWILYLVSRSLKPVWKRINAPAPLTLEAKVRLAQQVEWQRTLLERLNYLASHAKDLYIYLFQLGLTIVICITSAIFFVLLGTRFYIPALLLFVLGFALFVFTMYDARRLSDKHIGQTIDKVQRSIDESMIKLALPPRP